MVGWRFVKQTKDGIPQIWVVDLAIRFGLWGEHGSGAVAFYFIPVFADERFADAKKGTDRLAGDPSVACKGYHGAVAIQQATFVEVLQQNGEVWNVVELAMEAVLIYLLLEHPPHPFDVYEALPFAAGSSWRHAGTCGVAHE